MSNRFPLDYSDVKLLGFFLSAVRYIVEDIDVKAGQVQIDDVAACWQKKRENYLAGNSKLPKHAKGILSAVGYHVGEKKGVDKAYRHFMLDYIMSNELPPAESSGDILDWGNPNTLKRYKKLHRVLQGKATGSGHWQDKSKSNLIKAGREWNEDLKYIETKWKPAVS